MKILLQRVSSAEVSVDQSVIGNISIGIVAFIGIEIEDTVQIMQKMMEKLINLRIFPKENGHFDESLIDIKGDLLIVSQFTLMANCKKGRRPSFELAENPNRAKRLVDECIAYACESEIGAVASGSFGEDMDVRLTNDGPVTIMLDSTIVI